MARTSVIDLYHATRADGRRTVQSVCCHVERGYTPAWVLPLALAFAAAVCAAVGLLAP